MRLVKIVAMTYFFAALTAFLTTTYSVILVASTNARTKLVANDGVRTVPRRMIIFEERRNTIA